MEILRMPAECQSPACSARFFSLTSLLKVKVKHSDVSPSIAFVRLPRAQQVLCLRLQTSRTPALFTLVSPSPCLFIYFLLYLRRWLFVKICSLFILLLLFPCLRLLCLEHSLSTLILSYIYTVYGSSFFPPNPQLLHRPKTLITQLTEICSWYCIFSITKTTNLVFN